MENSLKAIIIGAGVVITMAVVSIGFILMRSGQNTAMNTISRLESLNTELSESQYTIYDGMEVSGSEVVNTIRRFKDEYVGIKVLTNKNKASGGKWYIHSVTLINNNRGEIDPGGTVGNISELMNEESNEYVNPNGIFTGTVIRDENGRIVALVFTQK